MAEVAAASERQTDVMPLPTDRTVDERGRRSTICAPVLTGAIRSSAPGADPWELAMETLIPLVTALVLLIAVDLEDAFARSRRRAAGQTGRA
ncbi:MAG TPA: hypothetical protein VFU81_14630 [Thermomicrobiales bacterium]|nr:hypothetical protein [Thermomicrobiales bacterium]